MPTPTRPQKITFGEMRDSGVRGLLIYCSDYRCSHSIAVARINGLITSGCLIWKRGSSVRVAARGALMSGRTSTGTSRLSRQWAIGKCPVLWRKRHKRDSKPIPS
jgi:hypothetical protein